MFEKLIEPFGGVTDKPMQLLVVGGAVRDTVLGKKVADVDFAFNGSESELFQLFPDAVRCHPHAPVFMARVAGQLCEIALTRDEVPVGDGGNSENFRFIPADLQTDANRRDVTINAVFVCVRSGQVFDPFDGVQDMRDGILRQVSSRFSESAERVGRVAMMIARFGFSPDEQLVETCKAIVASGKFHAISANQMWRQFFGKLLEKGIHFRKAFAFLEDVGVFVGGFEIFAQMRNTPQDAEWHPEGDVLEHTLQSMEHASRNGFGFDVVSAMMFHDMGKVRTTEVSDKDGRFHAFGHDTENRDMFEFFDVVNFPHKSRAKVTALVQAHMWGAPEMPSERSIFRCARRLAKSGATIHELAKVIESDVSGRSPLPAFRPEWVVDALEVFDTAEMGKISEQHSRPLVTGRDFIKAGFKPSRAFGQALDAIAEGVATGVIKTRQEAMHLATEFFP